MAAGGERKGLLRKTTLTAGLAQNLTERLGCGKSSAPGSRSGHGADAADETQPGTEHICLEADMRSASHPLQQLSDPRPHSEHPVRVLLVDDHPLLRDGIASVLTSMPNLRVVGGVGTVRDAVAAVKILGPDVVLLDHHLPDGEGIAECSKLLALRRTLRIVVVTIYGTIDLARLALDAGASGFILKSSEPSSLRAGIEAVLRGERFVDPNVRPGYGLTVGELRILRLLAEGQSNGRIAGRLAISSHTVKTTLGRAMAKLGATNRTEAAAVAVALGFARPHHAMGTIRTLRPQK